MVLYICRDLPGASWITEVDLSRTELRDVNFYVATVTKSQQATERAERKWTELTAKSPGLYDGELMSLREVKVTREGRIKAGIAKSSYKEHHGSCPLNGKGDDWTFQFFPYNFEVDNGIAIARIPNFQNLFPAFAIGALLETSDKKLVYLVRSNDTDAYKGALSVPSGGRIGGSPHKAVDDLIEDSSNVFRHITGMLQQEYPGIGDHQIQEQQVTGIARSLDDLDATLCVYAKTSLTFDQLKRMLRRDRKYNGMEFVSADADGMVTLLRMAERFPSSVTPVFIQAAYRFEVDPRDTNNRIELICD